MLRHGHGLATTTRRSRHRGLTFHIYPSSLKLQNLTGVISSGCQGVSSVIASSVRSRAG